MDVNEEVFVKIQKKKFLGRVDVNEELKFFCIQKKKFGGGGPVGGGGG